MKLSLPSLRSILQGLRTIFFHPMLYAAILLHWIIFNLPAPVDQAEELEEELLDESIPIASSASLGVKSKKPPQEKTKADQKQEKPKALAEALVKSDPKLAKLAEEKKQRELEAKKKAKEEKKRQEEEKKKAESRKEEEKKDKKEDDNPEDEKQEEKKEDNNTEDEKKEENDATEDSEKAADNYTAQGEAGKVGFDLALLPIPELVFTKDSMDLYEVVEGQLIYQSNVKVARWLPLTPRVESAVNQIKSEKDYQSYNFEMLVMAARKDETGLGSIYKLSQPGKDDTFVSFIKSNKRTKRSSTVFVEWTDDPRGSS